jgi:hypothetical protein
VIGVFVGGLMYAAMNDATWSTGSQILGILVLAAIGAVVSDVVAP